MYEKINKRPQSLLLATIAVLIMLGASSSAFAQKSWNAKTPKPDFTAMEEYYEIVEYEYDFTGAGMPTFNIIVKKKQQKTPRWWKITWRDAKGVKIAEYTIQFRWSETQETEIGEPIRGSSYAPWKAEMPKVKSISIVESLDG